MKKLTASEHVYNALIAAVITAVSVLFYAGVPWYAWVGAFAVLFLAAELASAYLVPEGKSAQKGERSTQLLYFAAVAAALLVLALIGYLIR